MWNLRASHLAALAIPLALVAMPRAAYDRLRLRAASLVLAPGPRPPAADPAAELAAVRAELGRARAEARDLARALALVTATREVLPGLAPPALLPVRVIAGPEGDAPSPARLRVDAGSRHGVRAQAAVVAGPALVGRVVSVGETTCEVETVAAQTFRVRARAGDVEGIVQGGPGDRLRFVAEKPEARLGPGDVVLTSGWSAVAPPGLAVGFVEGVEHDRTTGQLAARLRPAADPAGVRAAAVLLEARDPPGGAPAP